MFGLYITGIAGALLAALVLRRGVLKGSGGGFMMELPKYQWPPLKDVAIGLLTRAQIFLKRAGTIILGTTIILWALASIPQAGPGPEAERSLDRRPHRQRASRPSSGRSASTTTSRWRCCRRWPRAKSRSARSPPSIRSIRRDEQAGATRARGQAPAPLVAADRARLPRLVRVRAAVHLDHRRHPARDQWLEVAAVHGRLSVRAGLSSLPG